ILFNCIILSILQLLIYLCNKMSTGEMVLSMIKYPDIDASWYTGRGIRPVGRFGRKVAKRNEHLVFVTARNEMLHMSFFV
uniref:Prolactin releasing hormone n=1 Tax=Lates calcarifer TaxID=8187 RepID=A0A4W6FRZ5_LATCA